MVSHFLPPPSDAYRLLFTVMQSENDIEKPKGGGEDFENDLEANASAFEALERDFQEVCIYILYESISACIMI